MKKDGYFKRSVCMSVLILAAFLMVSIHGSVYAADQKPYELTISTIPAGFSSYIMGVALAEQINKNSKWLKAVATEGRGPAEHMKTLIKKSEKRKNYLFFNTTWDIWEAKQQIGTYSGFPFDYEEFRFVTLLGIAGNGLCTLDGDIKKAGDLVGKKAIFDSGRGKAARWPTPVCLKRQGFRPKKSDINMPPGKQQPTPSEMAWWM